MNSRIFLLLRSTWSAPIDRPVDTNGAGDAFLAGFAHSWLRNEGLEAAMESGAIMAAAAQRSAMRGAN